VIAFASLFLGLIVGVQPVAVLVEGPVAAVRFELDGKAVGRVAKEPWTVLVDFGAELTPHELVARALDAAGKEIGVQRQFVNLPRPPAEVEVLLERDVKGRPVAARYSGQSLIALRPARVDVRFDGRVLPADESNRVTFPDYDGEARHVLSVELEFSSAVRSKTDVVFGGLESGVARSELTAVAVRSASPEKILETGDLEGALLREARHLPVVAVEQGSAVVCVVRGPSVYQALKSLGAGGRTTSIRMPNGRRLPQFDRDASRQAMALEKEDHLRFIWPMPRSGRDASAQLFDRSRDFAGSDGGIAWLLTRVEHPDQHPAEVRLADAAAVAGLEAAGSGSRRAVVLVLGDETADRSRHTPASVRRYLETIRVPFAVWSLKSPVTQPLAKDWGAVQDVSSAARLEKAVDHLKADLASQRIVWVQGRHLPQEITLSEKAAGIELAR
jgi:hypothetical protein